MKELCNLQSFSCIMDFICSLYGTPQSLPPSHPIPSIVLCHSNPPPPHMNLLLLLTTGLAAIWQVLLLLTAHTSNSPGSLTPLKITTSSANRLLPDLICQLANHKLSMVLIYQSTRKKDLFDLCRVKCTTSVCLVYLCFLFLLQQANNSYKNKGVQTSGCYI